jgi:hypothetical protein
MDNDGLKELSRLGNELLMQQDHLMLKVVLSFGVGDTMTCGYHHHPCIYRAPFAVAADH